MPEQEVFSVWHSNTGAHNTSEGLIEFNRIFLEGVNDKLLELLMEEWEILSINYTLCNATGGWMAKEAFIHVIRY